MSKIRLNGFEPGLEVRPLVNPMGFSYGEGCFGPKEEIRTLDAIRTSLMDPGCQGPEIVYAIAMDVGKEKHRSALKERHLLFGVVTYAEGKLGKEPIRSQGHIHKSSAYAKGWSTPEVYQIWSGRAVIYMQETAEDEPGRCFAVYADPGDIVIVPPGWAHATISADPFVPLTFGAWCDRDYGFEYDQVRKHKGLAWYPVIANDGRLDWHFNVHYRRSKLVEKKPEDYRMFAIETGKCIYSQFEEDHDRFLFVPLPLLKESVWRGFIP